MNTERSTAGQRSDSGALTAEPLAKRLAGLKQVKRQRRTAPANQPQAPATAGADTAQTAA